MDSSSNSTHASLISRVRLNDSQAWSDLVDLYGPLIAHWCRKCELNSQSTADAVQEVFLAIAKSLNSFRPQRASGSFRAWLWTITANKVSDLQRRERRQPQAQGGISELISLRRLADENDLSALEPSDSKQLHSLVARGMAQVRTEFEPKTWNIFHRSVIEGITSDVVAKEFGVTSATVRQVRSRVLRRLRQQLGDIA